MFILIYIRILPVATSARPHILTSAFYPSWIAGTTACIQQMQLLNNKMLITAYLDKMSSVYTSCSAAKSPTQLSCGLLHTMIGSWSTLWAFNADRGCSYYIKQTINMLQQWQLGLGTKARPLLQSGGPSELATTFVQIEDLWQSVFILGIHRGNIPPTKNHTPQKPIIFLYLGLELSIVTKS